VAKQKKYLRLSRRVTKGKPVNRNISFTLLDKPIHIDRKGIAEKMYELDYDDLLMDITHVSQLIYDDEEDKR
jgi:hypothetical protein